MTTQPLALSQDARELRRGVLVTYAGYALKLGMPLLLALATRAYGAERWGRFLAAQAIVLLAVRAALFGLDKALLRAVASAAEGALLAGVRPACAWAALGSLTATLALWWTPATWSSVDPGALRICALALVPLALSELLLHASMGQRRMELQVAVRETLVPASHVLLALALARTGALETGLCWSFVLAQGLGLVAAWLGFSHQFRGERWPRERPFALPPALVRYAGPLWLAELLNSLALRMDTLALTLWASPAAVGVWGVVSQFANALRQMRRAYDPVVTALTARIALERASGRLTQTFSYASQMVSLTQLPVFAVLVTQAEIVLPLYGPEYARGDAALVTLAGFFLLSGGTSLAGVVLNGYGRSLLTLGNVALLNVLQLALLALLVPRLGLLGAALGVGVPLCLVNGVQLLQMRAVTGSFHQTVRSRFVLATLSAATAVTVCALLLTRDLPLGSPLRRGLPLASFALVYGAFVACGLSRGTLRAPSDPVRVEGDQP